HVDARLAAAERPRPGRHFGAREADVPAVRLLRDRNSLDVALNRAGPAHRDAPDLRQDQEAVVQGGAVAILLVGEAVVAVAALETGVAGRPARLHPTEEGLERAVQAREHVLQHLRVEVAVFGPHRLDGGQLGALAGGGDGHATFLPG